MRFVAAVPSDLPHPVSYNDNSQLVDAQQHLGTTTSPSRATDHVECLVDLCKREVMRLAQASTRLTHSTTCLWCWVWQRYLPLRVLTPVVNSPESVSI